MKLNGKALFSLALFVLVAAFVAASLGLSPEGRRVPLVVGVPTMLLLAFQVIGDAFPGLIRVRKKRDFFGTAEVRQEVELEEEEAAEVRPAPAVVRRREFTVMAWVVAFALLMYLFGGLLGLAVFNLLFLLLERERPWFAVAVTAGTWLFVYALFGLVLKVPFDSGILLKGL